MDIDPRKYTRRMPRLPHFWRAVVEIAFIIFLFYSNLLMGQYTANASPHNMSLWTAIRIVVTPDNFIIAVVTALIGHLAFEFLRKRI
jgi:uncharacterized paraquat-inducible protein A